MMTIKKELEELRKHIGNLAEKVEQGLKEEENKNDLEDLLEEISNQLDEFEGLYEKRQERERRKEAYYFNYAYNGVSKWDFV